MNLREIFLSISSFDVHRRLNLGQKANLKPDFQCISQSLQAVVRGILLVYASGSYLLNKRSAASYFLDPLTFSTSTVSGVHLNGLSPISEKAGIRFAMVSPQPRDWKWVAACRSRVPELLNCPEQPQTTGYPPGRSLPASAARLAAAQSALAYDLRREMILSISPSWKSGFSVSIKSQHFAS